MSRMTQTNKQGWDGLAETRYKNYHIETLLAGQSLLNDLIREEIGDVKGKSPVHLLCHIGTDTFSWALLGAKVTGIDISPESLTGVLCWLPDIRRYAQTVPHLLKDTCFFMKGMACDCHL
jgi:hypothetical protein